MFIKSRADIAVLISTAWKGFNEGICRFEGEGVSSLIHEMSSPSKLCSDASVETFSWICPGRVFLFYFFCTWIVLKSCIRLGCCELIRMCVWLQKCQQVNVWSLKSFPCAFHKQKQTCKTYSTWNFFFFSFKLQFYLGGRIISFFMIHKKAEMSLFQIILDPICF